MAECCQRGLVLQCDRLLTFSGLGHCFSYVAGLYYSHSTLSAASLFSVEDLCGAAAYITAANLGGSNALLPDRLIGGLGRLLGKPLGTILSLIPGWGPGSQSATMHLNQTADDYTFYGQFEEFFLPYWAVIGSMRIGLEHKTGSASRMAQGALVSLISIAIFHRTSAASSAPFHPSSAYSGRLTSAAVPISPGRAATRAAASTPCR